MKKYSDNNDVCEFDGYTLPEPLKEETPETKRKLVEGKKRIEEMAKRFHQNTEGQKD